MGFLGRLFGDDDVEKRAKSFFSEIVGSVQNNSSNNNSAQVQQQSYAQPVQQPGASYAVPSGLSWGENMPDEENQFNSGLGYQEYFEKIYREEFPDYIVTKELPKYGSLGCVFTFTQGGRTALVVEVLSQRTSRYQLKADCRKNGIGYTRFYYDHDGWWNTRSYVIERTRAAIN